LPSTPEDVIVNTGPLIPLGKIDALDLIGQLASRFSLRACLPLAGQQQGRGTAGEARLLCRDIIHEGRSVEHGACYIGRWLMSRDLQNGLSLHTRWRTGPGAVRCPIRRSRSRASGSGVV